MRRILQLLFKSIELSLYAKVSFSNIAKYQVFCSGSRNHEICLEVHIVIPIYIIGSERYGFKNRTGQRTGKREWLLII